jgi:hypothetical protein
MAITVCTSLGWLQITITCVTLEDYCLLQVSFLSFFESVGKQKIMFSLLSILSMIFWVLFDNVEIRSAQKYWQIMDSSIYESVFAQNTVVGIVWSTKVDYATWFGGDHQPIRNTISTLVHQS